jgi:hypothetical protein
MSGSTHGLTHGILQVDMVNFFQFLLGTFLSWSCQRIHSTVEYMVHASKKPGKNPLKIRSKPDKTPASGHGPLSTLWSSYSYLNRWFVRCIKDFFVRSKPKWLRPFFFLPVIAWPNMVNLSA